MSTEELDKRPLNQDERPLNQDGEGYNYDAFFKGGKPKTYAQKTAIGEFRNPRKFHWKEWAFLLVSMVSFLVVIALNIERFVTFHREFINLTEVSSMSGSGADSAAASCNQWFCTSDFVFTVCVTLNLVFCMFYCLDALFRERELELLTFIGACWVIAVYVVGNIIFHEVKHGSMYKLTAIKIVRLVFVCVCVPVISVLALIVYRNMGFLILNVIGSNKKLKRAYYVRAFFESLQFFNVQIMANIVVLAYAKNGQFISLPEKIIIAIFLFLLILVSLWGYIAVTWELKIAAIIWYFFMIPFGAFYIYELIAVSLDWSKYTDDYTVRTEDNAIDSSFTAIGLSLLLASILGIFAVFILSVIMTIAMRNFGVGLKDKCVPPFSKCVRHVRRRVR